MNQKKISVCVPAYNRPETIRQLINSFKNQTYPNKELVICDDSPTDNVKKVVDELNDGNIIYQKNSPSLGFPKNLLHSLMSADGDYRLTIGDDDILFSPLTLERYVRAFEANPSVSFIYPNMIQFNDDCNVECSFNVFPKDQVFSAGENAIKSLLNFSVFIGGQCFRGNIPFETLYPEREILHPQVQLVGEVLARSDGMGLSIYAVGARTHNDQIIFRAMKDKSIQKDGKHMTIELLDIFDELKKKCNWLFTNEFLVHQIINSYLPVMIKEKIILGNPYLTQYYKSFCDRSPIALKSWKLKLVYYACLILPKKMLILLRIVIMKAIQFVHQREYKMFGRELEAIIT